MSIIDLTFTTPNIAVLDTCVIEKELSTPLDYEVVVCDWVSVDETVDGMGTSQE